ncbi:MAG: RHS repeat domain-containing protein, partial [Mariprofundaceae bacterium]|nr:RHS repeat domain-containing protein [Mariprofundaceae bacterium]
MRLSYGSKGGETGLLTQIKENAGSLRYGYTAFGELASMTQSFTGGPKFTQSYEYDNAGRISAATLSGGQKITYSYDEAGRLAGIDLNGRPILTGMRYSALEGITSARWGNGLPYKASYDALGRVTSQTQGKKTVAYAYDKAGNITKQGNHTGQNTQIRVRLDIWV